MQGTRDDDHTVNRLIARHGHRKPDRTLTIVMVAARLEEMPSNSLRRQVLEQMIDRELE